MGYFNHLSLYKDFVGNRPDNSFPSRLMELNWRVEVLTNRLEIIKEKGYSGGFSRIRKEYLPYVLPEHLYRVSDVELAIELAQQSIIEEETELKKEYVEECPEERLSSPRVVIIPAAATAENNGIREKVRASGA